MDSKDLVIPICDTVSTTNLVTPGNLLMYIPKMKQESVDSIDEEESPYRDYVCLSGPLKSLEYVNYYDSKGCVLETVKKEIYEHELLQADSSRNSKIVSKSEKLSSIDRQDGKYKNTEEGLLLNIKVEDYNIEHQFPIKTEKPEDQRVLDCTENTRIHYDSHSIKKEGGNIEYPISIKTERFEDHGTLDYTKETSVHYDLLQIPREVQCRLCDKTFKNSTEITQEIVDIKIECNNDQGTSNSRPILPVRVDNKAAERSRLYRERHREEINQRRRDKRQCQRKNSHQIQTLSNIQNMNEIELTTQVTSNSRPLRSKSHTQRQQRYYERHKEEINKRKRDIRLQQKNPAIPATAAERSRKYRERNRQKINEQRKYSRLRQQNVQETRTQSM